MTGWPLNRPMPPRTAASSAKARSPASGVNSVIRLVDVILRLRAVGMAGDLGLLPRGETRVGGAQLLVGDGGQSRDLVGDVDAIGLRHTAELFDLAFQLGDGFFEVEEMTHGPGALAHFAAGGRQSGSSASVGLGAGASSIVACPVDPGAMFRIGFSSGMQVKNAIALGVDFGRRLPICSTWRCSPGYILWQRAQYMADASFLGTSA